MPIMMWVEASQRFRLLSPVEQNLTRAGNGFAGMILMLLGLFWFYSAKSVDALYANVIGRPEQQWVAVVFLLLFAFSLARFVVGVPLLGNTRRPACLSRVRKARFRCRRRLVPMGIPKRGRGET
jgi:hypothetical protein